MIQLIKSTTAARTDPIHTDPIHTENKKNSRLAAEERLQAMKLKKEQREQAVVIKRDAKHKNKMDPLLEKELDDLTEVMRLKRVLDTVVAAKPARRITITGTLWQIENNIKRLKHAATAYEKQIDSARFSLSKADTKLRNTRKLLDQEKKRHEWETETAEYNAAEKIAKKEAKKRADQLVPTWKLDKLPEDMVWIEIASNLMYDTKVVLLEDKYNPVRLLTRCSSGVIQTFYFKMVNRAAYFAMLSDSEIQTLLRRGQPEWIPVVEMRRKIESLFRVYKVVNPKECYYWMRCFSILINPAKKYKGYQISPRITSVPLV